MLCPVILLWFEKREKKKKHPKSLESVITAWHIEKGYMAMASVSERVDSMHAGEKKKKRIYNRKDVYLQRHCSKCTWTSESSETQIRATHYRKRKEKKGARDISLPLHLPLPNLPSTNHYPICLINKHLWSSMLRMYLAIIQSSIHIIFVCSRQSAISSLEQYPNNIGFVIKYISARVYIIE